MSVLLFDNAPAPGSHFLAARVPYKVEVAWGQTSGGLITFGMSLFGSSDVFASSSWSKGFAEPHADITNPGDGTHCDEIQITRGRSDDLSNTQAGTLTVTGRDTVGKYDKQNASSVLFGFLDRNQPIRVSAFVAGVWQPIYYGFLQSTSFNRQGTRGGHFQLEAIDLMSRLAPSGASQDANPVLPSIGATTTGAAIGRVLDYYQWTDPALRLLAVGDPIPDFLLTGQTTALQAIEDLLLAERGNFFIGRAGVATYQSRYTRYTESSAATIAYVMDQLERASDSSTVVNRWKVQRSDFSGAPLGVLQQADDATSQRIHNIVDQSLDTPYLSSDGQALGLAQYLVQRTKDASSPVWDMGLRNKDAATLAQMVTRDLGDRVTVVEGVGGTTKDYYIEQITHDISLGGTNHETTWKMSAVPAGAPFRFGVSMFGGSDTLAY